MDGVSVSVSVTRPLKVLLVLSELSLVGTTTCILNLFEAFKDRVDVRILVTDTGPMLERFQKLGPVTLVYPMITVTGLLSRVMRKVRRAILARQIREWMPDLIYANSLGSMHLLHMVSLPMQRPVLLHIHELDSMVNYGFQVLGGPVSDLQIPSRYIAVTSDVKRLLTDTYSIDPNIITCIPPPIADSYVQNLADRKYGLSGKIVVGGAGTMTLRKGVVLWLQMAAALVKRVGPDRVTFQWLGAKESYEDYLYQHIAKKLGIGDSVEFLPVTKDPGVHYRNFDIFAMTSWEDPCPMVVFESMAHGIPVVCFDGSGGAPEQVSETGIVVPDFCPTKMAAAIERLIVDPELHERLGRAAAARCAENFVTSVIAPQVFAELSRVVAERPIA